jgi:hypothetical protein
MPDHRQGERPPPVLSEEVHMITLPVYTVFAGKYSTILLLTQWLLDSEIAYGCAPLGSLLFEVAVTAEVRDQVRACIAERHWVLAESERQ